jgi:heat shock protein HtpX
MPEFGIYQSEEPNAFATWATKNNSLVAVSTGLIESMDKDAIEWVMAHEMAHILNWDMVTMTLLQWVLNTFVVFFAKIIANIIDSALSWDDEERSWWSFTYIMIDMALQMIFWLIAGIIVMWFSRHREYKADAWSAFFVWKDKMIDWLRTLQKLEPVLIKTDDSDPNATFKIESKPRWWIMRLFASHPPLEDRIKALENLKI